MRIELRDDQWVELREHISHGQDKEIRRAQARSRENPETAGGDGDTAALRVFIRDGRVNDPDGNPIVLTDGDAMDRLPQDIADQIAAAINDIYHAEATVPNAPTPS